MFHCAEEDVLSDSIPYVNAEAVERALSYEQRVAELPEAVGIVAVSVVPEPISGGKSHKFQVVVHTDRSRDRLTTEAVLRNAFLKETSNGEVELTLRVFPGRRGAAGLSTGAGSGSPST